MGVTTLENISKVGMETMASEYMDAAELEDMTGTPKSTWRYWAVVTGEEPPSLKLGRRRVWKRADVLEWLAQQEKGTP
jgi:prophage regulatory protein